MLGKTGTILCWALLAGWLSVSIAGAEANRVGGKFGVFGTAGYSTYAMKDFNQTIDDTKDSINNVKNDPGFGYTMPNNLDGGLTFDGGVQYAILDYLAVGVEIGALTASPIKYSVVFPVTTVDYTDPLNPVLVTTYVTNSTEFDLSTMEIGPIVRGYLPLGEKFLLNASLGVGYVSMTGKIKNEDNGTEAERAWSGHTVGVKMMAGGEYFLSDIASVGLDLGYRMAKIPEVYLQNFGVVKKDDGSNFTLDYSGLIVQVGLHFYF
jgi:opacity protein-like surface antigen